jgi:6-phosphogluconate dehydrogenase
MKIAQIGLIGLGVMGANLARNIASRSIDIAVYNRSRERTEAFLAEHGNAHLFAEAYDIAGFVASIERPRKIIVMVPAGKPIDDVITELIPHLSVGDCIIDCGNSHYRDTVRREAYIVGKGFRFMGCGVSGGEQ